MALTHQNTTFSGASVAATAITTQNAMRDALVGHPSGAWTLEDEFDSASGAALHWQVVKCSTALSGVGVDFRVVICKRLSDGVLWVGVGEDYNTTTKALGKYAPWTNNSASYILANGTWGANGTTEVTWTLGAVYPTQGSGPVMPNSGGTASAATQRFFSSVEKDYAIFHVNGTTFYVGALTDLIVPMTGLVATPAIGAFSMNNTSNGDFGAITRMPIAAADAPMYVYYSHAGLPFWTATQLPQCGLQWQALLTSVYGAADRLQANRIAASEIAFVSLAGNGQYGNASNRADKVGSLRAKFKGARLTTIPYGASTYDTVVVDGRKHVIHGIAGALNIWSPYIIFNRYSGDATGTKVALVYDTGIAAT